MADVVDLTVLETLVSDESKPIGDRIRALFTLRNECSDEAVRIISKGMYSSSELLAHEAAYCLGQIQNDSAIPYLKSCLSNVSLPVVVRHEAGEALGNYVSQDILDFLLPFVNDSKIEVAETCQIAVEKQRYFLSQCKASDAGDNSCFVTHDPAPAFKSTDLNEMKSVLLDPNQDLFSRYRALFALRNMCSDDSANVIASALRMDGALFKHELGFVLGQMRMTCTASALMESVRDKSEHPMVRHECAEALGSIASDECNEFLQNFVNDPDRIVRESCLVALDISEYCNSDQLNYC